MHIVHICPADKFIPGFIDFVRQHFDSSEHQFWIYGDCHLYGLPEGDNVFPLTGSAKKKIRLIWSLLHCRQVIFHSFHGIKQALLLLLNPWCLKKTYWFIWGGDLYQYHTNQNKLKRYITESIRRCVISRMTGIVTYIRGDYLNACRQYKCAGQWYECLMYTSNVFTPRAETDEVTKNSQSLKVLVGNSALPTNNHLAAFDIIHRFCNGNVEIVCPLSYGLPEYGNQIKAAGHKLFGERFTALMHFMPADDYITLLKSINFAVFNHTRQQAMGNTIALIGEGKTVFLNKGTTQWSFFEEKGIKVCDFSSFSLIPLSDSEVAENKEKIRCYFSSENLRLQLDTIFNKEEK